MQKLKIFLKNLVKNRNFLFIVAVALGVFLGSHCDIDSGYFKLSFYESLDVFFTALVVFVVAWYVGKRMSRIDKMNSLRNDSLAELSFDYAELYTELDSYTRGECNKDMDKLRVIYSNLSELIDIFIEKTFSDQKECKETLEIIQRDITELFGMIEEANEQELDRDKFHTLSAKIKRNIHHCKVITNTKL